MEVVTKQTTLFAFSQSFSKFSRDTYASSFLDFNFKMEKEKKAFFSFLWVWAQKKNSERERHKKQSSHRKKSLNTKKQQQQTCCFPEIFPKQPSYPFSLPWVWVKREREHNKTNKKSNNWKQSLSNWTTEVCSFFFQRSWELKKIWQKKSYVVFNLILFSEESLSGLICWNREEKRW